MAIARTGMAGFIMEAPLQIDGIDVFVEGEGEQTVVMVHGWPDTYRLWDAQVDALKAHHRCGRFTLPGFDVGQRHRARVAKIIGVDIGDARSGRYARSLSMKAKAMVVAYQVWLAAAWRIGGSLGDSMTRVMARAAHAPAEPPTVHAGMNYPYDIRWTGSHGSYKEALPFDPACPMLFIYGTRKPFLFHSPSWAEALAARDGCRVLAFETGHWVMAQQPQAFNEAVRGWLG